MSSSDNRGGGEGFFNCSFTQGIFKLYVTVILEIFEKKTNISYLYIVKKKYIYIYIYI